MWEDKDLIIYRIELLGKVAGSQWHRELVQHPNAEIVIAANVYINGNQGPRFYTDMESRWWVGYDFNRGIEFDGYSESDKQRIFLGLKRWINEGYPIIRLD